MARIDPSASSSDQAELDRLHVVGSFFAGSPERILSVAAALQQASRVVESTVQGACMGASLPDGSAIRIQLCQGARYEPGEVVACLVGTKLVTHRVVYDGTRGQSAGVLITRSDDKLLPDPPVHVRSVLGRVIAIETRGRWIPPPAPAKDTAPRRAIAWAVLVVIAALSRVSARWAGRVLIAFSRWRDRLYPIRRWFGAARRVPPTL